MKPNDSSRPVRFRRIYDATYADALRFAKRRTQMDADDVMSEAYLVVWRRLDDAPQELSDARPWVFGIVRNCLLNAHRSDRRRQELGVRLADAGADRATTNPDVAARVDLSRAWNGLEPADQEALSLAVFEGLSGDEAAAVIGISGAAYRARLSRARTRLRAALNPTSAPQGVLS